MSVSVYLMRTAPFAASCTLHLALVGIVAGLVPGWTPHAPAVLEAEIVDAERPAEPREVAGPRPRVAAPRPTVLPRLVEAPKPPTPLPEPARAPVLPEPAPASSPPLPAPAPSAPAPTPASRESFAIAATEPPATSAELKATTDKPAPVVAPPPAVATAPPDESITRMAAPSGGYQVRPSYPSTARRLGIEGTSMLRVHVAADGRVTDVQVDQSAGHPDLDRAAADAVRRWKFEPGRRGSEPIGMWVRLPVQFVLK
jgi:periplasmic protein TonB